MTSTFSTIINFSMLGLLRRLHRLQIQSHLQAESHHSGVIYPQVESHKNKDGKRNFIVHILKDINKKSEILEAVNIANIKAKETINNVEKEVGSDDNHESDIDDDEQLQQDARVINSIVKEVCMDSSDDRRHRNTPKGKIEQYTNCSSKHIKYSEKM